ncbi:hypothetical protein [Jannaschia sp. CCS1]|uniref:hypothetical protein n=1 Tax=Jannaschia sp. (strain CCS1) TaxID=290400 RepID=UPI000310B0FF|nr:hypothetical protein [Jannaschia sp. CCS1]
MPRPVLNIAPSVAGTAMELDSLTVGVNGIWHVDGQLVSPTAREYRLRLDGVIALGPQDTPTFPIPDNTGDQTYTLDIRALANGSWSNWNEIDTGTVANRVGILSLDQMGDNEIEIGVSASDVTITINTPAIYAGTYIVAAADLASGPVNIVQPVIVNDGTPTEGEILTVTPGLWVYDPDNGGVADPLCQWQSGNADTGLFTDITGATAHSYQLTAAETAGDVRVEERINDAGGARTQTSATLAVPGSGTGIADITSVTATPAGFVVDYTGTLTATSDTFGIKLEAV